MEPWVNPRTIAKGCTGGCWSGSLKWGHAQYSDSALLTWLCLCATPPPPPPFFFRHDFWGNLPSAPRILTIYSSLQTNRLNCSHMSQLALIPPQRPTTGMSYVSAATPSEGSGRYLSAGSVTSPPPPMLMQSHGCSSVGQEQGHLLGRQNKDGVWGPVQERWDGKGADDGVLFYFLPQTGMWRCLEPPQQQLTAPVWVGDCSLPLWVCCSGQCVTYWGKHTFSSSTALAESAAAGNVHTTGKLNHRLSINSWAVWKY